MASDFFHTRNYEHAKLPTVTLAVDNFYSDKLEISWSGITYDRFHSYVLYKSTVSPIVDTYDENAISDQATLLETIYDPHHTTYRVSDLTPNTTYYLALVIQERNGLKGFSEITAKTLT